MNVLVVDDHAIVRRGIRELIAEAYPDASVSEATNANDVLGRTVLPAPPFKLSWAFIAAAAAAVVTLISALP